MMHFAAPKDNAWVAKKSHASQFGDTKHTPVKKAEWGKEPELVAEPMPQFIKDFVDRHVKATLSQTELGRAFLEDLKAKATEITEVPDALADGPKA